MSANKTYRESTGAASSALAVQDGQKEKHLLYQFKCKRNNNDTERKCAYTPSYGIE